LELRVGTGRHLFLQVMKPLFGKLSGGEKLYNMNRWVYKLKNRISTKFGLNDILPGEDKHSVERILLII